MTKKALVPVIEDRVAQAKPWALPLKRKLIELVEVPSGSSVSRAVVVYTGRELEPQDVRTELKEAGLEFDMLDADYLMLAEQYLKAVRHQKVGDLVEIDTLSQVFALKKVEQTD